MPFNNSYSSVCSCSKQAQVSAITHQQDINITHQQGIKYIIICCQQPSRAMASIQKMMKW